MEKKKKENLRKNPHKQWSSSTKDLISHYNRVYSNHHMTNTSSRKQYWMNDSHTTAQTPTLFVNYGTIMYHREELLVLMWHATCFLIQRRWTDQTKPRCEGPNDQWQKKDILSFLSASSYCSVRGSLHPAFFFCTWVMLTIKQSKAPLVGSTIGKIPCRTAK